MAAVGASWTGPRGAGSATRAFPPTPRGGAPAGVRPPGTARGEAAHGAVIASAHHSPRFLAMAFEPRHRLGELFRLRRIHEESRLAVDHDLFEGRDAADDDRLACRHRFDDHLAEALGARGE